MFERATTPTTPATNASRRKPIINFADILNYNTI